MTPITHVAVAVIVNQNDEVCISLRHKDSHQGGLWEFPGGKIEAGESVEQALVREIKEEIDLDITHTRPLIKITHDYIDKSVCLHVHKVISYTGKIDGREGQQVKWLPIDELQSHAFPEANQAIIKALFLPDKYLITGKFLDHDDFVKKLSNALDKGMSLIQLRLKDSDIKNMQQACSIVESAAFLCDKFNARLMLNLPKLLVARIDLTALSFTGFHLDSHTLNRIGLSEKAHEFWLQELKSVMPEAGLLSASCHDIEELALALKLNADFVVLSPVQKTASHPEMEAIGWQQFEQLIEHLPVPAFALGGVSEDDLNTSIQHGAQGIAAISAFWS